MPKFSFSSHPYLLGFERLEVMLERSAKSCSDGYPPYNIEQSGEDQFRISLAVAGFALSELSVVVQGPELIVSGAKSEISDNRDFVHQGISARPFERSFVLAERVEVLSASLKNGLLTLDLRRLQPESQVHKVEIVAQG